MSFKVATYNILATAYINPEWYVGIPPDLLRPEWRIPALVRHVASLAADLLCLQEVENDTFSALDRHLRSLGYGGHYEQKGRGRTDGCATFFRQGLFTLHQLKRLDYHDGEGGAGDSGHIALLLALEYQGRLLGVANTHLRWYKPGTPPAGHVGYRQAVELVQAIAAFAPACRGWLVCGDFNSAPDGDVVAAMRRAGHSDAHAACPEARSCVANGRASLIDYIFHTRELRSRPFDPGRLGDDTWLPSPEQPSDHLALVAEMDWA
jgi:mRNA deadenylase 3'-5' endonuclease subunit Ccr4